jgi:hypothetical protein
MAPSMRRRISKEAKQMFTALNNLVLKFNKAKRIYTYLKKFKFNQLKKLREHKRNLLLKKDLFYGRTQSEL